MLKIYLTRHGQDQDNFDGILNGHRDTDLTNLGLKQASDLARMIKKEDIKIDKIYSSPLKRAHQTAKIISEFLKLDNLENLEMLIERDFGEMTGKLVSESENLAPNEVLKTSTVNYFLEPKGGESFPDLFKRACLILEFLKNKHKEGSILLVSHGDIGKMIYAAYYNLDWQDALVNFHFGNSDLLLLSGERNCREVNIFKAKQYNK